MDIITDSLHYINSHYKDVKVLQIGAMDGFSFDDIRGYLEKYKWDELLVEPIPKVYNLLCNNLEHRSNCVFENSAIISEDKIVSMVTVDKETIEENNLQQWYEGMSALFPIKNGFGAGDEGIKDTFGKIVEVNGITLKTLINKHNIQKIDVLLCDAEGYDWNIFSQLDLNLFNPYFIRLEYINLTKEEQKQTQLKLDKHGYIYEIGHDITAVKEEIYNNYK